MHSFPVEANQAPQHPIAIVPEFQPHRLLRSGHAQTLAAVYFPGPLPPYRAVRHEVLLPDGDRLVLHDDQPTNWSAGQRVALWIHGRAGGHAAHICSASPIASTNMASVHSASICAAAAPAWDWRGIPTT